jgi:uncharacterized protein YbjQ (UPF0145 family)
MAACVECKRFFRIAELDSRGCCPECSEGANETQQAKMERIAQRKARRANMTLTTETALNLPIEERLGVVSAEAVVGMNLIKDVMLDVRDIFGGASKTQQKALSDIREALLDQIADKAADLGADMVVGLSLSFSDYGSRGQAILGMAFGTAVRLAPNQTD